MDKFFFITIKRFGKANKWLVKCTCGHSHMCYTFKGAVAEKDMHMLEHNQPQEPCS